jgi:hypothetical protein
MRFWRPLWAGCFIQCSERGSCWGESLCLFALQEPQRGNEFVPRSLVGQRHAQHVSQRPSAAAESQRLNLTLLREVRVPGQPHCSTRRGCIWAHWWPKLHWSQRSVRSTGAQGSLVSATLRRGCPAGPRKNFPASWSRAGFHRLHDCAGQRKEQHPALQSRCVYGAVAAAGRPSGGPGFR